MVCVSVCLSVGHDRELAVLKRLNRSRCRSKYAVLVGPTTPCIGEASRGVVGGDAGGRRPPVFFDFFGLKFVQKLVHCCNWLLTETQCKIISVYQN